MSGADYTFTDYPVSNRGDSEGPLSAADPKEPVEVRAMPRQSSGNTSMFDCKDMHQGRLHGEGDS